MKQFLSIIFLFITFRSSMFANTIDHYNSGAKLTTVVVCVAVILIGIGLFLFYLERRIKKMEDN